MTTSRAGWALAAICASLCAGCGKPEAPKAASALDRKAAIERARKDVLGTQVEAHQDAQGIAADMNKKAEAGLDAADRMSK